MPRKLDNNEGEGYLSKARRAKFLELNSNYSAGKILSESDIDFIKNVATLKENTPQEVQNEQAFSILSDPHHVNNNSFLSFVSTFTGCAVDFSSNSNGVTTLKVSIPISDEKIIQFFLIFDQNSEFIIYQPINLDSVHLANEDLIFKDELEIPKEDLCMLMNKMISFKNY